MSDRVWAIGLFIFVGVVAVIVSTAVIIDRIMNTAG